METNQKTRRFYNYCFPFSSDFRGKLRWNVLGIDILNAASLHAAERGFSIRDLKSKKHSWVLSRLTIQLDDYPREYQKYSIETWIYSIYRNFTDRHYTIYNQEEKPIGYAKSVWAMIDLETRKGIDFEEEANEAMLNNVLDIDCPIEKHSKVRVKNDKPCREIIPHYNDIDINGHVNSIKFIEYILDLFTVDKYKEYDIYRLEISYMYEAHYGEKLQLFIDEESESIYNVEIRNEEEKTLCTSKVFFRLITYVS